MQRYRSIFPRDEAEAADGDVGFAGVNMRLVPSRVPQGYLAGAINMRFQLGRLEARKGVLKLAWTNQTDGILPTPFDVVYGVGVFADPDDVEWVIIAANGKVYFTREGHLAKELSLPAGVTIYRPVTFVQAVSRLIMFRGPDASPLQMTDVADGFTDVSQYDNEVAGPGSANPFDGTATIPNAERALFMQNRLFIPYDRDLVAVSDYLNVTRYQPQAAVFRINQGSPDRLISLAKFNEQTILAFKEQSVYRVTNVYGDLSDARLDEVTRQYGCKSPRSIIQVGTDVWFLADQRGVVSINQTESGELQAVDVPVSEPIQPLIDRINWDEADGACAAYYDNKFYLAVPLDAADWEWPSLIAPSDVYDAQGQKTYTLKKGRVYHWTPGTQTEQLFNGGFTIDRLITTESDFVAENPVVLSNPPTLFSEDWTTLADVDVFDAHPTAWNVDVGRIKLIKSGYDVRRDESFGLEYGRFCDLRANHDDTETKITSNVPLSFTLGTTYHLRYKVAGGHYWPGYGSQVTARFVNGVGSVLMDGLLISAERIDVIDPWQGFAEYQLEWTAKATQTVFVQFYHRDWNTNPDLGPLSPLGPVSLGYDGGAFLDDIRVVAVVGVGAPSDISATLTPVFRGINNAVLVYDFLNRAWSGYDIGTDTLPLSVKEWLLHTYNGERRLFATTPDGFIEIYEENLEDEMSGPDDELTMVPIVQEWTTRGYTLGTDGLKRWKQAVLDCSTWNPRYTISAITEGDDTRTLVSNRTRSRRLYHKPFDKAPWIDTNINNDHGTANRQDYSVQLFDAVPKDGVDYEAGVYRLRMDGDHIPTNTPGSIFRFYVKATNVGAVKVQFNNDDAHQIDLLNAAGVALVGGELVEGTVVQAQYYATSWRYDGVNTVPIEMAVGAAGIDPNRHAHWPEHMRLALTGRWIQLSGRCDQGRLTVNSIEVTGSPGPRGSNMV